MSKAVEGCIWDDYSGHPKKWEWQQWWNGCQRQTGIKSFHCATSCKKNFHLLLTNFSFFEQMILHLPFEQLSQLAYYLIDINFQSSLLSMCFSKCPNTTHTKFHDDPTVLPHCHSWFNHLNRFPCQHKLAWFEHKCFHCDGFQLQWLTCFLAWQFSCCH